MRPATAIDYGGRARIGMLIPSANFIVEPQVRAMLPAGVTVHFTRLPLRGSSTPELLAMVENVESAAALLADADVELIAFNCTAVSTFSSQLEAEISHRIETSTRTPAVTTGQALIAALNALGARKVMLLTPYTPEINARESAFLQEAGVEVVVEAGLGMNTPAEMAALPPGIWLDLARRHHTSQADAILISCTAVRSADIISVLEKESGRPVVTSNQALVWHALRLRNVRDAVDGFRRLFSIS
jgi:maleate isomerase